MMKKTKLVILLSLMIVASAFGKGKGWIDLFNGGNLDGWVQKS